MLILTLFLGNRFIEKESDKRKIGKEYRKIIHGILKKTFFF